MTNKKKKASVKVSTSKKSTRQKASIPVEKESSSARNRAEKKLMTNVKKKSQKAEIDTNIKQTESTTKRIEEFLAEIRSITQKKEETSPPQKETTDHLIQKVVHSSLTEDRHAGSADEPNTEETKAATIEETGEQPKRRRKKKKRIKTWEEKAKELPVFEVSNYPKLPVKDILITQSRPPDLQNPYQLLENKYKVNIHFRPFIKVEGLSAQEFRNQRVDVQDYQGIIFTSRLAIDHFFRLIHEMRISLSESTKFFCLNEQIGFYMQKYMELRKRRILWGQSLEDFKNILKKNKNAKFLLPASDTINEKVIGILDDLNVSYTKVDIYKTVLENIKDLKPGNYDMIVFFTPIAVEALHKWFPKFKQGKTRFAAYSLLTANKLKDLGYRIDLFAPTLEFPSMVDAIAHYLLHIEEK